MIPNMNPAQMKKLMQQMGIKNSEVPATRVVVEKYDGTTLVVEKPQVLMIEMGGNKSLQVSGEFREGQASEKSGEGTGNKGEGGEKEEREKTDVEIVMEQTGATREQAEAALAEAKGEIADAIMLIEAKK